MINDIFAKISPFFEKYVFLKLFSISKVLIKNPFSRESSRCLILPLESIKHVMPVLQALAIGILFSTHLKTECARCCSD